MHAYYTNVLLNSGSLTLDQSLALLERANGDDAVVDATLDAFANQMVVGVSADEQTQLLSNLGTLFDAATSLSQEQLAIAVTALEAIVGDSTGSSSASVAALSAIAGMEAMIVSGSSSASGTSVGSRTTMSRFRRSSVTGQSTYQVFSPSSFNEDAVKQQRKTSNHPSPKKDKNYVTTCNSWYCDAPGLYCVNQGARMDVDYICCQAPHDSCVRPPCWHMGYDCPKEDPDFDFDAESKQHVTAAGSTPSSSKKNRRRLDKAKRSGLNDKEFEKQFGEAIHNGDGARRQSWDDDHWGHGDDSSSWGHEFVNNPIHDQIRGGNVSAARDERYEYGYQSSSSSSFAGDRYSGSKTFQHQGTRFNGTGSYYADEFIKRRLQVTEHDASVSQGLLTITENELVSLIERLEFPVWQESQRLVLEAQAEMYAQWQASAVNELELSQLSPELAQSMRLEQWATHRQRIIEEIESLRVRSQLMSRVNIVRDKVAKTMIARQIQLNQCFDPKQLQFPGRFNMHVCRTANLNKVHPAFEFPLKYVVPAETPGTPTPTDPRFSFAFEYVEYHYNPYAWMPPNLEYSAPPTSEMEVEEKFGTKISGT